MAEAIRPTVLPQQLGNSLTFTHVERGGGGGGGRSSRGCIIDFGFHKYWVHASLDSLNFFITDFEQLARNKRMIRLLLINICHIFEI